jgi:hypothetical protein
MALAKKYCKTIVEQIKSEDNIHIATNDRGCVYFVFTFKNNSPKHHLEYYFDSQIGMMEWMQKKLGQAYDNNEYSSKVVTGNFNIKNGFLMIADVVDIVYTSWVEVEY